MVKLGLRNTTEQITWEKPGDMPELLYRLYSSRGINSAEEYRAFVEDDPEQLWKQLNDPFKLSDMDAAASAILDAVNEGSGICVYGDYDADGVCASAILYLYLRRMGAEKLRVYLPSRGEEGYGLNEAAIDDIAQEYSLLVSVDCGITAHDLVEYAKDKGMKVVITDHHRPDELRPVCSAVVDPLLGDYPFRFLCGAGVAFKLVQALAHKRGDSPESVREYIDLAALATIADIVSLTGENRAIAKLGLRLMNTDMRPGLKALIEKAGIRAEVIDASTVAFKISPRINACGRMDNAYAAFELLTGDSAEDCAERAVKLNEMNEARRSEEKKVMDSVREKLKQSTPDREPVIIVRGEDWHKGVIGLAASRIADEFGKPAVVFTRDGESYIGSCRSVGEIDIQEALTHMADILERFGGHKLAAGLKLKAVYIDEFTERLKLYLADAYSETELSDSAEFDAAVKLTEINRELAEALTGFEPTGCENPVPVLCLTGMAEGVYPVGPDKSHLKFSFTDGTAESLPCIWYRNGNRAKSLSGRAKLLFTPKLNTWQGRTTVQAEVVRAIPETEYGAYFTDCLLHGREMPGEAEYRDCYELLPDKDGLRRICKACMELSRKPGCCFADKNALVKALAEMSGADARAAAMGYIVLEHMGTVMLNKDGSLSFDGTKRDPLEDDIYRTLAAKQNTEA